MKRRIRIYIRRVEEEIELPDGIPEDEISSAIDNVVYSSDMIDNIKDKAEIFYWEEIN